MDKFVLTSIHTTSVINDKVVAYEQCSDPRPHLTQGPRSPGSWEVAPAAPLLPPLFQSSVHRLSLLANTALLGLPHWVSGKLTSRFQPLNVCLEHLWYIFRTSVKPVEAQYKIFSSICVFHHHPKWFYLLNLVSFKPVILLHCTVPCSFYICSPARRIMVSPFQENLTSL